MARPKTLENPPKNYDYNAAERNERRLARIKDEGGKRLPIVLRPQDVANMKVLLDAGYGRSQTEVVHRLLEEKAADLGGSPA